MIYNSSTNVNQKNTLTYDFNNTILEELKAEEIKRQLLLNIRPYLSYLLPNGTFHGDEFRVGDIRGNRGQSLRVALTGEKAGLWQDFATGEKGDAITMWAKIHGKDTIIDFREIIASIAEWLGYKKNIIKDLEPFITYSWNYLDENGQVIVSVYRYDTISGKEYRPFDVKQSRYGAPEIRPLYNIPGILKSEKVILVEGEKCAEALIEKGITATTTMSGANAPIDKNDWTPLKGKHIIIWPDNDEVGQRYAERAARKLLDIGVLSLSILKIPQGKPQGWDAADYVQNEETSIEEFILNTKSPYLQKNQKELILLPGLILLQKENGL